MLGLKKTYLVLIAGCCIVLIDLTMNLIFKVFMPNPTDKVMAK